MIRLVEEDGDIYGSYVIFEDDLIEHRFDVIGPADHHGFLYELDGTPTETIPEGLEDWVANAKKTITDLQAE